jgi:Xaa-Pro aminopeptidase
MEKEGLNALVVFGNTSIGGQWNGNFTYLSNYCLIFSHALIFFPFDEEPVMFIPGENQLLDAKRSKWIEDSRLSANPAADLCKHLKSQGFSSEKIGISSLVGIPSGIFGNLRGQLPHAEFLDAAAVVFEARELKSDEEVEVARRGARVADKGWDRSLEIIRPGLSELEYKAELEKVMTAEGANGYFNMLSAGRADGEEDAFRGFVVPPTERKFREGDLILLEITPRVDGYWNQIVRLVSLGEPSDEIQKAHEACLDAKRSALSQMKPGERFTSVAEVIRNALEKHGYTMKGVGSAHTTGLDLSESIMNLDNRRRIEPGLLVTVHPMTATGDWRQLFVGETYFLHTDRLEMLNHCEEEISIIHG